MSKQTKIVVIKSKDLLYKTILLVAIIIFICVVFHIISSSKSNNKDINTYNKATNTNSIETMSEIKNGNYTTSINFAGTPLNIEININEDITNISITNLDDTINSMYPLLQPAVDDINEQLKAGIPIEEVTYSADNQYTSIILLDAIKNTLNSKE